MSSSVCPVDVPRPSFFSPFDLTAVVPRPSLSSPFDLTGLSICAILAGPTSIFGHKYLPHRPRGMTPLQSRHATIAQLVPLIQVPSKLTELLPEIVVLGVSFTQLMNVAIRVQTDRAIFTTHCVVTFIICGADSTVVCDGMLNSPFPLLHFVMPLSLTHDLSMDRRVVLAYQFPRLDMPLASCVSVLDKIIVDCLSWNISTRKGVVDCLP